LTTGVAIATAITSILGISFIGSFCMPFNLHTTTKPQAKIEETRQSSVSSEVSSRKEPAAFRATVNAPRGVLKPVGPPGGQFFHLRLTPPPALARWVQHFWMVEWDLRGVAPRLQETLPHPSVYLVFEQKLGHPVPQPLPQMAAEISGVSTGKFSRRLEGWSRVFGVKFKPGGFRTFLGEAMSTITDCVLPAQQVFGPSVLELAACIYRCPDADSMAGAISTFLGSLRPSPDASADLSAQLVELIFDNPAILTVDQLAAKAGMSARSLQRLFKEYVGVPPKWVIRRYRLHELVERLHSGEAFDGAHLALDLGYADQAHLINDFRNLVGYTPTGYREVAGTSPQQATRAIVRRPSVVAEYPQD
jgi:AraC-like DNA-binding protein